MDQNLLDVVAISADLADEGILRIHFRRRVTEQDRKALLDAINQYCLGSGQFQK